MKSVDNLIAMANQIGEFFETMPDRRQALDDIAGHLTRFWEPRMRRALLDYMEQQGGSELKAIVREAISMHKGL